MGNVSRDEAKRAFKKEGQDIMGSKTALKRFAKDKGKGKGKPICERHGDGKGTQHWHDPGRGLEGHGFIEGAIGGALIVLNYIDPVDAFINTIYGELAGPEDTMIPSGVQQ